VVAIIIAGFAFFGIANIRDFKADISERVTEDLKRSDQATKAVLALRITAEKRIQGWDKKVTELEKLITASIEKADRDRRLACYTMIAAPKFWFTMQSLLFESRLPVPIRRNDYAIIV